MLRDGRLDARALVDGLGVEDRQEALGDQVVDLQLVLAHAPEVVLGARGDDRVVVLDLLVVDDPPERQAVQPHHVLGRLLVLPVVTDQLGDRLDLGDHVAGQEARVRARVGERLVLLVEPLGGGERAAGGEAEARVGVALQRGQVVEERRALGLLLALDRLDLERAVELENYGPRRIERREGDVALAEQAVEAGWRRAKRTIYASKGVNVLAAVQEDVGRGRALPVDGEPGAAQGRPVKSLLKDFEGDLKMLKKPF